MKKIIFLIIVLLIGAAAWFYFNSNSSTSLTAEIKQVSSLVNLEKYYKQPLGLLVEDYPDAEYGTDRKKIVAEVDQITIVSSVENEDDLVHYALANLELEDECTSRNFGQTTNTALSLVGLSRLTDTEPTKENPDLASKLFCDQEREYSVNVSCFYNTSRYVVDITDLDPELCS